MSLLHWSRSLQEQTWLVPNLNSKTKSDINLRKKIVLFLLQEPRTHHTYNETSELFISYFIIILLITKNCTLYRNVLSEDYVIRFYLTNTEVISNLQIGITLSMYLQQHGWLELLPKEGSVGWLVTLNYVVLMRLGSSISVRGR